MLSVLKALFCLLLVLSGRGLPSRGKYLPKHTLHHSDYALFQDAAALVEDLFVPEGGDEGCDGHCRLYFRDCIKSYPYVVS